jgi:hypothetical protein
MTSCQRAEDISSPEEIPFPVAPSETVNGFQLELSVPGSGVTTYATEPSVGDEHAVKSLYLLFFEKDAQGNGQYIHHYEVPPASVNGIDFRTTQTPLDIQFGNNSPLNKSTDYSILAIANVVSPTNASETIWGTALADWLASFPSFTQKEVIGFFTESRSGVTPETDYTATRFTQNNLLMSGEITKQAGQSTVKLALSRLVSRFDVKNYAGDYELVSASLWNAFPQISIWERQNFDYSDMRLKRFYGKKATSANELKGGLYAFENYVTTPVINDNLTTCLIIGLKKTTAPEVYYYRLNVNAYERPQQLKRNNIYMVSIQRVNAPGASTESAAYESEEQLLEVIINAWNMGQNGEMLYNGESVLILPASLVTFTARAESRTFRVHTQGVGTLSISNSTLPEGLTASLSGDELTISATNGAATPRSGYVELAFGSLKGIINVNQVAALEKYIELSVKTIPTFAGNRATAAAPIRVNSSGEWNAELYNVDGHFTSPPRPAFTFGKLPNTNTTEITGNNNDELSISSTGENTTGADVISFLLVQLKADPTVRQVIMLTQKPTGGFSLGSQQKQLQFNALGERLPGASNDNRFTVTTTNPDDTWTVVLSGTDATAFKVQNAAGNAPFVSPATGDGTFTIAASDNAENKELSAVATISLGGQSVEVKLTQAKHVLSITPTSVVPILVAGGTTPNITVNSSATGKSWTATLLHTTSQQATLTATTGTVGGTFAATFPVLTQPFIVPQSTITVTMNDYPWLKATLVVTQQSFQPRYVTLQTSHALYGTMSASGGFYNYTSAMGNSLRATANFGPGAAAPVRTASGSLTSWPQNATVSSSAGIFLVNAGLNATQRAYATSWKNANKANLLLLLLDLGHGEQQALLRSVYGSTNLGVNDPGIGASQWANNYSFAAPTTGGSVAGRAKLWAYLVGGDGPFGTVNPAAFKLTPYYDHVDGRITNMPSTMIPLVIVNGIPMLSIDPTKNVVVIGNMDMFSGTNNNFPANSDKWKFLQNFLAYMVNAAQYGDVFLNQFK